MQSEPGVTHYANSVPRAPTPPEIPIPFTEHVVCARCHSPSLDDECSSRPSLNRVHEDIHRYRSDKNPRFRRTDGHSLILSGVGHAEQRMTEDSDFQARGLQEDASFSVW